jgi:uncharacterized protein (DUF302 family)
MSSGVVTKSSAWSVEVTVARLQAAILARGLKLFAVIDQTAEAAAVGLELRETRLIVFGSPRTGTPVMQANPLAAVELPLKVVVWADGAATKISYTTPAEIGARYGLSAELVAGLRGVDVVTDIAADAASDKRAAEDGNSKPGRPAEAAGARAASAKRGAVAR